jgi:ATP-binding cassette subfamily F protein uup
VDEYLERRAADLHLAQSALLPGSSADPAAGAGAKAKPGSAEERAARKTLARLDKQLARLSAREAELHAQLADAASDHERLAALGAELGGVLAEKDALEVEWLEAAEVVE